MYVVAAAVIDAADIVVGCGDDDVGDVGDVAVDDGSSSLRVVGDVAHVVDVADVRAAVVVGCDVAVAVDAVAISDLDVAESRFCPETEPSNALGVSALSMMLARVPPWS